MRAVGSPAGRTRVWTRRQAREARAGREIAADLVIVGGGLGGCAAALAALGQGLTVVLTETTDWIGGQLTSQAVPPDEHPWIEQFGRNARYQALRTGIRDYYRKHYPLTAEALADPSLQSRSGRRFAGSAMSQGRPGGAHGDACALCVGGKLLVLLEHDATRAEVRGDSVSAVVVRDRKAGTERTLTAPFFIDATELGDLLPLAGVEFVIGAESQAETGEPHALATARPDVQQAITCCFAMDYLEGQDHTIDRPVEYDFWRSYVPKLDPPWPGKLLDLTYADPITLKPASRGFDPTGAGQGALGLSADHRSPQLSRWSLSRKQRGHPGELAAERLLAGPAGGSGRDAGAGGTARRPRQAA